jgi:hypothetical protein
MSVDPLTITRTARRIAALMMLVATCLHIVAGDRVQAPITAFMVPFLWP